MNLYLRRRPLACERLESRQLLAADLHLSKELPSGPLGQGDEVSYSFAVTNRGEDVQQLRILDTPSAQLDDVSWTRSENSFPTNARQLNASGGFVNKPQVQSGPDWWIYNASVDGGGDYNGDGFADAISGSLGSVEVILGGPQSATFSIATRRFVKAQVVDLGDFDDDGFDDFAVALSPSSFEFPELPAETIIVYGRTGLEELAGKQTEFDSGELTISTVVGLPTPSPGTPNFDRYTLDVANPGDLNADGHDDVVVAVVGPGKNSNLDAQAIVLFGGQAKSTGAIRVDELDGSNGFVTEPFGVKGGRSKFVAGGDLNDDGTDDLVLASDGAIHVHYGHESLGAGGLISLNLQDEALGFTMAGLEVFHVDIADDINGDGIADLLAGSVVLFGGGDWLGSANFLSSMLDGDMGFRIVAGNNADRDNGIGYIGDINSDGVGDFALGVNRPGDVAARSIVHVVFGRRDIGKSGSLALDELNGALGFRYREIHGVYGYAFAGVGDMNGDGIDDFVMDTTRHWYGTTFALQDGAVYFFPGQAPIEENGTGDIVQLLDLPAEGSVSFTVTGRLRSNVEELMVAPSAKPPVDLSVTLSSGLPESLIAGQSVTYEFELFNHADDVAEAARIKDEFAAQLEDVTWTQVVGVPPRQILYDVEGIQSIDSKTADALYSTQFRLFDFNGDGVEDDMSEIVESAVVPKNWFAHGIREIANLGDVNTDGFSDLWISSEHEGRVVFGAESSGPIHLEIFEDGRNSFWTGGLFDPRTAAAIGDVNADGIDDFAVSTTIQSSLDGRGAAFVVYGSRELLGQGKMLFALDGIDGFILTGEAPFDPFLGDGDLVSRRLGAAGDFNGDGIDDFVVGSSPGNRRLDHVVFGRAPQSDGTGPVDEEVTLPSQTRIRFTVTGTVPSNIAALSGEFLFSTSPAQQDRDSANNSASLEITVKRGDINGDKLIDFSDFLILSANFGREDASAVDGDLDGDKVVGFRDFLLLSQHFGG